MIRTPKHLPRRYRQWWRGNVRGVMYHDRPTRMLLALCAGALSVTGRPGHDVLALALMRASTRPPTKPMPPLVLEGGAS